MDWMSVALVVTMIGIGSNLDNSGIGMAYGSANVWFPHRINAVVNIVGGSLAGVGALLGSTISMYLPTRTCAWISCLILCSIGLFFWYSGYIRPNLRDTKISYTLQTPTLRDGIVLGFGLSITNLASGFGSTVSGTASLLAIVSSITLWGYVMIWLGNWIAISVLSRWLSKYASFLAGMLLVGTGIHQVI